MYWRRFCKKEICWPLFMTVVASYNIHKAIGTDMRRDPGRIIRVIAELRADILALQEVDRRFGDRRGVLDTARLEAETGLTPVMLTDRLGHAAHGWHGNLLLLRAARVDRAEAVTLPGLEPRGAIVADVWLERPAAALSRRIWAVAASRRVQARLLARHVGGAGRRPTM